MSDTFRYCTIDLADCSHITMVAGGGEEGENTACNLPRSYISPGTSPGIVKIKQLSQLVLEKQK